MMDPDYIIGISDGILTQLDYLLRLSERVQEMRPDLLRRIYDEMNEFKASLPLDPYESLRSRRNFLIVLGDDHPAQLLGFPSLVCSRCAVTLIFF